MEDKFLEVLGKGRTVNEGRNRSRTKRTEMSGGRRTASKGRWITTKAETRSNRDPAGDAEGRGRESAGLRKEREWLEGAQRMI